MDALEVILFVHAAATIAMAGVIWFVQVVHYPLFDRVGAAEFAEYESRHSRLTTQVVAPLMLVEAAAAVSLLLWLHGQVLVWLGIALLAVIWASTFCLQVPQHRRLERGFDASAHRRLVKSNWIRTIGWSVRSAISLALLTRAVS